MGDGGSGIGERGSGIGDRAGAADRRLTLTTVVEPLREQFDAANAAASTSNLVGHAKAAAEPARPWPGQAALGAGRARAAGVTDNRDGGSPAAVPRLTSYFPRDRSGVAFTCSNHRSRSSRAAATSLGSFFAAGLRPRFGGVGEDGGVGVGGGGNCGAAAAGGANRNPPAETEGGVLADLYGWHLTDVRRLARPLRPAGHPQPVWFEPFLAA
jgi:hypothetical protein